MNHKKPLADLAELRGETPNPDAVDRTVNAVLSYTPHPQPRPMIRWRMATVAAGIVALAAVGYVTTRPASAAGLEQIAAAMKKQQTRYSKTVRPDANGNLVLANEVWIDGRKHAEIFRTENGKTFTGYDGERMFHYSDKDGGFVDDVAPSSFPIEDLETYLNIPNGKLAHKQLGLKVDGRVGDLYRLDFGGVHFDLYIDPVSHLPFRRDVMSKSGNLIERDMYEYPVSIPASVFKAPAMPGLSDYPVLRRLLAQRLSQAGVTKQIGGVKISLKAVIVGQHKILVLWTGGAKAEIIRDADMWIEGQPKPVANGRPNAFSNPPAFEGNFRSEGQILTGKQVVLGDGAWLAPGTNLDRPFRINVPVWAEDRSQPMKPAGFHSKMAGRLTFDVTNPIYAEDPDRVLWRPNGDPVEVATTSSTESQRP